MATHHCGTQLKIQWNSFTENKSRVRETLKAPTARNLDRNRTRKSHFCHYSLSMLGLIQFGRYSESSHAWCPAQLSRLSNYIKFSESHNRRATLTSWDRRQQWELLDVYSNIWRKKNRWDLAFAVFLRPKASDWAKEKKEKIIEAVVELIDFRLWDFHLKKLLIVREFKLSERARWPKHSSSTVLFVFHIIVGSFDVIII